jgi:hypothetical protein
LFFTSSDLEILRRKTETPGLVGNMWKIIQSDADKLLAVRPPVVSNLDTSEYGALYPAQRLAFVYLITGKVEYAKKALDFVRAVMAWNRWIEPSTVIHQEATFRTTLEMAVVYDWLYNYMNATERSDVRFAFLEKGVMQIINGVTQKTWWWNSFHHNYAAMCYGSLGVAALSVLSEVPEAQAWLDLAKEQIGKVLDAGGENGGWGEGIQYWQYGIHYVVFFIDALRRVTGQDLYQHHFLKETLYFPLYSLSRGGQGFLTFSDSWYRPLSPNPSLHRDVGTVVARLASEYRNGYGQWLANASLTQVTFYHGPWSFLWYDPTLSQIEPHDLPLTKNFQGLGWVIMRTGWRAKDILFALKSGPIWNHGHADQNSFILEAYGERLVDDLGYGDPTRNPDYFSSSSGSLDYHIASASHNTILVNGEGQVNPLPYWGQLDTSKPPYMGGSILQLNATASFDYVIADASKVYGLPLKEFQRQAVFVRPYYFVIFDQLSATKDSLFDWLLHTTGDISVDGDTIYVTSGNVTLAAKILMPRNFSFNILRDQYISKIWGEAPSTVAPYIKMHPTTPLVNCQFVVALYPQMNGKVSPQLRRVETPTGFDIVGNVEGSDQTMNFRQNGTQMYLSKFNSTIPAITTVAVTSSSSATSKNSSSSSLQTLSLSLNEHSFLGLAAVIVVVLLSGIFVLRKRRRKS